MAVVDGSPATPRLVRTRRKTAAAVRTPLYRYLITPVVVLLFRVVQLGCRVLPPAWVYLATRGVALVVWHASSERRQFLLRNLDIALGDKYSVAERRRIGRQSVQHFLLTVMDLFLAPQHYLTGRWREFIEITPEQQQYIETLKQHPGPVAFFQGHCGSWEVGHAIAGLCGGQLALIYRPLEVPQIEAEVARRRGIFGNPVLPKKGALRGYLRMLRQNGWVGVIADQNAGRQGGFVSFFGVPVSTEIQHFQLFQRFPTRLCAIFVQRDGFRFRFRIRAFHQTEIRHDTDEHTEAMRLAQWYMDCVQRMAEESPEQYDWMHRRFRTRPPGAPSLYENLTQPLNRNLLRAQPPTPIPAANWDSAPAAAAV
jgi:KDO2-lipid IV(A) lauroyltransferase